MLIKCLLILSKVLKFHVSTVHFAFEGMNELTYPFCVRMVSFILIIDDLPGGFILESRWESDFDLKNWLFLVSRCSHRRIYYNSQNECAWHVFRYVVILHLRSNRVYLILRASSNSVFGFMYHHH